MGGKYRTSGLPCGSLRADDEVVERVARIPAVDGGRGRGESVARDRERGRIAMMERNARF
jgi:hypothetical protein